MKKYFPLIALFLFLPRPAPAQATQFYLEESLNKWKVKIYVIGDAQAKQAVQDSLYRAVDAAKTAYDRLDAANPAGELGLINQKKIEDRYTVSPELARAVDAGLTVSRWTKGFFDITFDSTQPDYKKMAVNVKDNEIKLKDFGMVIDLRHLLRGFLADTIVQSLNNDGWKNSFVKIGNAFVAKGNDATGPWKVPIVVPTEKLAKRALFYKATDLAAATVTTDGGSLQIINPKTRQPAASDLKSATIFTDSAAMAEGLATAIYVMGLEEGKKFLHANKNLKAVLVDAQGNLIFIPEFKKPGEKPASP